MVTYNGWPLYTYASDIQPGQATGQGIDLNGGKWYGDAPVRRAADLEPSVDGAEPQMTTPEPPRSPRVGVSH